MDEQLKSNLTSGKHWLRLCYMLLFAIFLQVASAVLWVVVAAQFLFALVTGRDNTNLRRFGDSLSIYVFQALQFLTYNIEEKPFPFSDWPEPQNEIGDYDESAASQANVSTVAEEKIVGEDIVEEESGGRDEFLSSEEDAEDAEIIESETLDSPLDGLAFTEKSERSGKAMNKDEPANGNAEHSVDSELVDGEQQVESSGPSDRELAEKA